jgi:hypothetical protein
MKPATKPRLDQKLEAWGRAFHATLDEMRSAAKLEPDAMLPLDLITTAAATSATLVQYGTDLSE